MNKAPLLLFMLCVSYGGFSIFGQVKPAVKSRDPFVPVPPHVTVEALSTKSVIYGTLDKENQEAYFALVNSGTVRTHAPHGKLTAEITEKAFQLLYKNTSRLVIFNEVVIYGTNEGAIYGLCGLYLFDRQAYEKAKAVYIINRKGTVNMWDVDIEGARSINEALKHIDSYDLAEEILHASPPRG